MGKTLTFRGTVFEAREAIRTHRCADPICGTHMWKVKNDLDMAHAKLRSLEEELIKERSSVNVSEKGTSEE
jgi:hypothetical protein